MRIVACLGVLISHAVMAYPLAGFEGSRAYLFFLLVFNGSSMLFFTISGALLLPVRRPWREFVTRRVKRIIIPLLAWAIISAIIGQFIPSPGSGVEAAGNEVASSIATTDNGGAMLRHLRRLCSMFYSAHNNSYWFLYVIMGFYAAMPLLTQVLNSLSKRWVECYLLLWIGSSFIPYLHGFFYAQPTLTHPLGSFANYLGYIILGYYLNTYPLPITGRHARVVWLAAAMGIIVIPLLDMAQIGHFGLTYWDVRKAITDNVGINIVCRTIVVFSLVKLAMPTSFASWPRWMAKRVTRVSISTFGIYLVHMRVFGLLIVPHLHPALTACGWLGATLIEGVVCFAVSYAIVRLISLLPGSKYLIGY